MRISPILGEKIGIYTGFKSNPISIGVIKLNPISMQEPSLMRISPILEWSYREYKMPHTESLLITRPP